MSCYVYVVPPNAVQDFFFRSTAAEVDEEVEVEVVPPGEAQELSFFRPRPADEIVDTLVAKGTTDAGGIFGANAPFRKSIGRSANTACVRAGHAVLIGWDTEESRSRFVHCLREMWRVPAYEIELIRRDPDSPNLLFSGTLVGTDKQGRQFHVVTVADLPFSSAVLSLPSVWNSVPFEDETRTRLRIADVLRW